MDINPVTPKYSIEALRRHYITNNNLDYFFFWGHKKSDTITKSCLSQWWIDKFTIDSTEYCCMEQYMMVQKAELFGDEQIKQKILEIDTPSKIKALGRKVKNFDDKLWDKYKYAIVLNGNYYKFKQNECLKNFLFSTGDKILAEASPYDTIWGIGMSINDQNILNPLMWKGKNLLGFALMEVRARIGEEFY